MTSEIKLIAYRLFTSTDENGLAGWPSESFEIFAREQDDYMDAGFLVNYIFNYEAYKDSMIDQYNAWQAQYHPEELKVKIHKFTVVKYNETLPPFDVDYVSGLIVKLHRKSIIVKGECTIEEFYENFDGTTFSNLIVKEESIYVRNALGFPTYKDVIVSWTKEDGSLHSVKKTWRKYYSQLEQILEGKTRRGNLISNIQMPTMGLISLAMTGNMNGSAVVLLEGRKFLAEYKNEFETFISDSNKDILRCFTDSTFPRYMKPELWPWIDFMTPYGVTIRQYLANEINI